jgi:hypothetical protein
MNSQTNNRYEYSGTIGEDGTKEFEIKMTPIYTGKYDISYYLKFKIKEKEYILSERIPFTINTEGLNCYFETNEENKLEAGTELNINVAIENNDDENYYEIIGEIINPFGDNIIINKTNLEEGKIFIEELENIILPITSEDKEYIFDVKATYRSLDREKFQCESALPILVKGRDKYINISIKTPNQSIRAGSEFELTFLVENLIDEQFENVYVEHEFSGNVSSTGVSRKQFDDLGARETKEEYNIKVKIPETFDKDYFEIMLKVGAKNPEYENAVIIEIPINTTEEIKNETEIINNSSTNNSEITNTTPKSQPDNSDEGLVDKVINFFIKLFKGNKK